MTNIKIQEIREYLEKNPQYYSLKNTYPIEDIKSQNKYYFIADCGHEFFSLPCNVFKTGKLNCPVCSGHQVLKGFNDLWTTHPVLASMLQNPEEGYLYSVGSNKKLNWICPDCGAIASRSPNRMSQNVSYCQECNKLNSYGEKFMVALLTQLCECFEKEKEFDWSDNKRYDFYLPFYKCIIEIHGKQHYCDKDFSKCGGRNYIEEQINDEYKKELAFKNGIQEYIVIENKDSDMDMMKQNILNSLLPTILNFTKKRYRLG